MSLKKGEKVKAVIEAEKFDKEAFLGLSGIWKDKTEEEIGVYKNIRFWSRGRVKRNEGYDE